MAEVEFIVAEVKFNQGLLQCDYSTAHIGCTLSFPTKYGAWPGILNDRAQNM